MVLRGVVDSGVYVMAQVEPVSDDPESILPGLLLLGCLLR